MNRIRSFALVPTVAALLTVAVVSGCGGAPVARSESSSPPSATAPAEPETFSITGGISVLGAGFGGSQSCYTDEGYDDIQEGANVIVTDPSGDKIAVGGLDGGRSEKGAGGYGSDCVFAFTVEDIPEDVSLYTIEVSHRGELTYKRDELNASIDLTLG